MTLSLVKVTSDNINKYLARISKTMCEEYIATYKCSMQDVPDWQDHLAKYILDYVYILLYHCSDVKKPPKLLGYLSLSPRDLNQPDTILGRICDSLTRTYYIFDVYVFQKYRGKGIGTYLVKRAVKLSEIDHRARRLVLYTASRNLASFYHRNGFTEVGNTTLHDGTTLFRHERKMI